MSVSRTQTVSRKDTATENTDDAIVGGNLCVLATDRSSANCYTSPLPGNIVSLTIHSNELFRVSCTTTSSWDYIPDGLCWVQSRMTGGRCEGKVVHVSGRLRSTDSLQLACLSESLLTSACYFRKGSRQEDADCRKSSKSRQLIDSGSFTTSKGTHGISGPN